MKKILWLFAIFLMCGVVWSQAASQGTPPLYEEEALPPDLAIGGETTKPRKPNIPTAPAATTAPETTTSPTAATPATGTEKVDAKPVTLPPPPVASAPPPPVATPPPPPAEPEKTLPSNIPVVTPPPSATIPPPPAPSIPAPAAAPTMPPPAMPSAPVPSTMPSPMPQVPSAMPEAMPPGQEETEPMPPEMAEPMPPPMEAPAPTTIAPAADAGPAKDAGSDRYSALPVTFQIYAENFLDVQDTIDVFKLFARAGEGIGVIVTPSSPQMQMSVELMGENGELLSQTQAPNPGAPISFQTSPLDKNSVIYLQIKDMNLMMGVSPPGETRKYSLELKPLTAPEPPPPPPTAMEGTFPKSRIPEEPLPPEGEGAPGFFSDPLMLYGGIGLGVLGALLAVMMFLRKRRAKAQAEAEEVAEPLMEPQPAQEPPAETPPAEEEPKKEEEQGGGPPHAE